MSYIISAGTAPGKITVTQDSIKDFTYQHFSGSNIGIDKLITVFENSNVSSRHISAPLDWIGKSHTFKERNDLFILEAIKLSKLAIEDCLKNSDAKYDDIDAVIFVTSTGISTPTPDAILFNDLGLKKNIKRIPLWGLGCAGGAAGISRAFEFTKAYPQKNALVVAVELCSLTFQGEDKSKSNVIAASLFSDGAAAVLIAGSESRLAVEGRVKIIDTLSTIYKDSLDVMGWKIVEKGFSVIFSRDIPAIVKDKVLENIEEISKANNYNAEDIKYFVTHPGGLKVINAYEESLSLPHGTLSYSRKILNEHGNMSSPSVIFVLKEFLNDVNIEKSMLGLLSSLGPGFCSELVLFRVL